MNSLNPLYAFIKPFLLLIIFSFPLFAQKSDNSWKVFDDSEVARIDVTVSPAALSWMYNNPQSDSTHIATIHFKNKWYDETVDTVGFRLKGNTSREAMKKSFKISFNSFGKNRKFHGLEKLNLNGEHNDPSIMRSKLIWDLYQQTGYKASRASYAALYINGQYYGLYISVEHIDEEFLDRNFTDGSGNLWKCLFPADLVYKGSSQDLYKTEQNGARIYDLATNTAADDYSQLARLINTINNVPLTFLPDSLESVLYVPGVLKYFAMDVMTGSWDDYWFLKNNYYLYHEPASNMFKWIPFDADNAFGIDWFNIDWTNVNPYTYANFEQAQGGSKGARPLATRIMSIPQYRDLYTHFIDFSLNNVYTTNRMFARIDALKNMITPFAEADTYKKSDYGFTNADFHNSFSETSYSNQHVKKGLKQFISQRIGSLKSQLNWVNAAPIVYKVSFEPAVPGPNDTITVYASAFSKPGLSSLSITYKAEGSASSTVYPMTFTPVMNTLIVDEADRWTGKIPPLGNGVKGTFTINAKDVNQQTMVFPRNGGIKVKTSSVTSSRIVINEILAKNDSLIADDNGQYEDWIELYNPTSSAVNLAGKFLTDSRSVLNKWMFSSSGSIIEPGRHLIVWCDNDVAQPGLHANFKLDADGEFTALVENDGVTIIDSVKYISLPGNISYGRYPDASDNWQLMEPSFASSNLYTSVKEDNLTPAAFTLSAYPNPFNSSTTIQYSLSEAGRTSIGIYDILGRLVWTEAENLKAPGTYSLRWNGRGSSGFTLNSGVYFCRIMSSGKVKTVKLMLLK